MVSGCQYLFSHFFHVFSTGIVIARSAATKQSRFGGGSLRGAAGDEAIQCYNQIMKTGHVYILFNKRNGTLYTGVTSDLVQRVYQHKEHQADGFSKQYNTNKLGYYEDCGDITTAIEREKQIKGGSRKKKLALIESMNPDWRDLYDDIWN